MPWHEKLLLAGCVVVGVYALGRWLLDKANGGLDGK